LDLKAQGGAIVVICPHLPALNAPCGCLQGVLLGFTLP